MAIEQLAEWCERLPSLNDVFRWRLCCVACHLIIACRLSTACAHIIQYRRRSMGKKARRRVCSSRCNTWWQTANTANKTTTAACVLAACLLTSKETLCKSTNCDTWLSRIKVDENDWWALSRAISDQTMVPDSSSVLHGVLTTPSQPNWRISRVGTLSVFHLLVEKHHRRGRHNCYRQRHRQHQQRSDVENVCLFVFPIRTEKHIHRVNISIGSIRRHCRRLLLRSVTTIHSIYVCTCELCCFCCEPELCLYLLFAWCSVIVLPWFVLFVFHSLFLSL